MAVRLRICGFLMAVTACVPVLAADGRDLVLERWVEDLAAADPAARLAAARGLSYLGETELVRSGPLLELLEHAEASVRQETLVTLREIGLEGDAVAAGAWRRLSADPDREVRRAAAKLAKARAVSRPLAATELRRCLGSAHADSRKAAVTRLGNEPGIVGRDDLKGLVGLALDDDQRAVRKAALNALIALERPISEQQATLRARLTSGDAAARLRTARLLEKVFGGDDDGGPVLEEETLQLLADLGLGESDTALGRAAFAAFATYDRPHQELAARFLAIAIDVRAPARSTAIRSLGVVGRGTREEVDALVAIRLEKEGPGGAASSALVQLVQRPDALEHVLRWLDSPDEDARKAAVIVTGKAGIATEQAWRRLEPLALQDDDASVRVAALKAFVELAPRADARRVLALAEEDRDLAVQRTARVQGRLLDLDERREQRDQAGASG